MPEKDKLDRLADEIHGWLASEGGEVTLGTILREWSDGTPEDGAHTVVAVVHLLNQERVRMVGDYAAFEAVHNAGHDFEVSHLPHRDGGFDQFLTVVTTKDAYEDVTVLTLFAWGQPILVVEPLGNHWGWIINDRNVTRSREVAANLLYEFAVVTEDNLARFTGELGSTSEQSAFEELLDTASPEGLAYLLDLVGEYGVSFR